VPEVDANLGAPTGGVDEVTEPRDVGRADDVLDPGGQRLRRGLSSRLPEGVAVEGVAADAQVAGAEGAQQVDQVAGARVEIADAEFSHFVGKAYEILRQHAVRVRGVNGESHLRRWGGGRRDRRVGYRGSTCGAGATERCKGEGGGGGRRASSLSGGHGGQPRLSHM